MKDKPVVGRFEFKASAVLRLPRNNEKAPWGSKALRLARLEQTRSAGPTPGASDAGGVDRFLDSHPTAWGFDSPRPLS